MMMHLSAAATYAQTHVLAILVVVVLYMFIGFMWHGPVFGKQWLAENKMPMPKKGEVTFAQMIPSLCVSIAGAIVQAILIGLFIELIAPNSLGEALLIVTGVWFGFTALNIAAIYSWSGKTLKHFSLDAIFYFVEFWMIAIVIYIMR